MGVAGVREGVGLSGKSQQRDAEFAEFVRVARARLCRSAYLMCGDRHKAEDIVQTALIGVHARWESIDRGIGPEGYTHRAVVNAAIDEHRRPWRRERCVDRLPDLPAPGVDEFTARVAAALRKLPAGQRAVVVLRHVEDLDVEATAALLGISTGTVKSQAAKALAALRIHLAVETADHARAGRP
jgi:RNA polymerase sigma-70 factor (sigma-E family)